MHRKTDCIIGSSRSRYRSSAEPELVALSYPPSWPLWTIHSLPLWSPDPWQLSPAIWIFLTRGGILSILRYELKYRLKHLALLTAIRVTVLQEIQVLGQIVSQTKEVDHLGHQDQGHREHPHHLTNKHDHRDHYWPAPQTRGHHLKVEPSQSWLPLPSWSHGPPSERALWGDIWKYTEENSLCQLDHTIHLCREFVQLLQFLFYEIYFVIQGFVGRSRWCIVVVTRLREPGENLQKNLSAGL